MLNTQNIGGEYSEALTSVENAIADLWNASDGMTIRDFKAAWRAVRNELQNFISEIDTDTVVS